MEEPEGAPKLSKVLGIVLPRLESAQCLWPADAFLGHTSAEQSSAAALADQHDEEEETLELAELPQDASEELDAALRVTAARGAAAKLVSLLACTSRAALAAADAFAGAEVRAARGAHASAMHSCALALREACVRCYLTHTEAAAALRGLAAWCRVKDATSALDGRFGGATSAAEKWRAFARDFADAAAMPRRIEVARRTLERYALHAQLSALSAAFGSSGEPPPDDEEALEALVRDNRNTWRARLMDLTQGAPAT